MTGEFEVLGMAAAGYVTSPDGSALETQDLVTSKLHHSELYADIY